MKVREFIEGDLKLINKWLDQRNLKEVQYEDLPRMGIVIYKPKTCVAAGFLRMGEGFGIIDSVITNPFSSSLDRGFALDMVFDGLINKAKMIGLKRLIGSSIDENTILRSERFGFTNTKHTLMSLSLGENS